MKSVIAFVCIPFIILISSCVSHKQETPNAKIHSQETLQDTVKLSAHQISDSIQTIVTLIELGSVKCIPCKMMQKVLDELEKDYKDQVKIDFHDVWTEEGRPFAEKYGIQAIPTQIFLDQQGNEYYRHTGFFPKDDIIKILKQKGVQ